MAQVIHGVDVVPGLFGRTFRGLDRAEMQTVGPEILAAHQNDGPDVTGACRPKRVLEPPALFGAHGTVVEIEMQVPDPGLLAIPDLPPG